MKIELELTSDTDNSYPEHGELIITETDNNIFFRATNGETNRTVGVNKEEFKRMIKIYQD